MNPYSQTEHPMHSYTPVPVPRAQTNALAIVSLVSSILGIVLLPIIGSIVGIIAGHVSLDQMNTSGEEGRGQGLAGTLIGYVGLVVAVPAVISFFVFLPLMLASIDRYL